jgi:hypothetical protein
VTSRDLHLPDPAGVGDAELGQVIDGLLQQVTISNAAFEVAQRRAWFDMARTFPTVDGIGLGEGLSERLGLSLRDVTFRFSLEEVGTAWPRRMFRWAAALVGHGPKQVRRFRFASAARTPLQLEVRVARHHDDSYGVERSELTTASTGMAGGP